ncbi:DUF58 domain-containing protein [Paracoccus seriniphilus]|uniref:DUF58 domain-containing protein n=1 Tax=Paracoccus seriniphilus TaxID=184748 RepID=A0A239PLD9_9RHOB|nr:DUF58 domain-containing protein [Paracoccus seriniphilus]SNT68618.1 Protein of unknown function DUF58 [Paracoccus seriniphilus]
MTLASLPDGPGIRISRAELLALRDDPDTGGRMRPATRRPGAVAGRNQGSGMDLREIRAYVPGDDPRRLDPAATARTGHPHIRSLHEDRDDITLLLADYRAAMIWGTATDLRSVRAARFLARAGWQAARRGGSTSAVTVSAAGVAHLAPATGDRQMADIAELLAHQHDRALTESAMPDLGEALALAARLVPAGGRVTLATCPGGWRSAEAGLARLARKRRVTVALILDESETAPPKGVFAISNGTTSHFARLTPPELSAESARLTALGVRVQEVLP